MSDEPIDFDIIADDDNDDALARVRAAARAAAEAMVQGTRALAALNDALEHGTR